MDDNYPIIGHNIFFSIFALGKQGLPPTFSGFAGYGG